MHQTSSASLIFWWSLLVAVSSSAVKTGLCPAQEDIYPCACVTDGENIRIDCIQLTSVDELRSSFKGLVGVKHINLDILKCRFPEVPSDIFLGLDVIKVSFTNSIIHGSNKLSFSGLEKSLKELSVIFSFEEEKGLSFLDVSNLHSLEHLEIEGNSISKLGNDWFQNGPKSLENVCILTNLIEELGDKAFSSLVNIRNLWLTGNKFATLYRSMFPQPAKHLASLDLTENELVNLPADLFSDMPALKEVILTGNRIRYLYENTWSTIWEQLTRVYVDDNPLSCDTNISWMLKRKRPYVLKGKCADPLEKKGKELKYLIEEGDD